MTRYFCHTCKKMMTRINPDYTCPHCDDGFIEESQVDLSEEDNGSPAPMDLLQFFYSGLPPAPARSPPPTTSTTSSSSSSSSPSSSSQSHHHHHHHHHHSNPYHFRPLRHPHQATSQNHYQYSPPPPPLPCSTSSQHRHSRGHGQGHGNGFESRHHHPQPSSRYRPRLENSTDSMLYSFISDLVTGLGGGQYHGDGGNRFPFLAANFGDYVWGRDGLDSMVTQLMNNMEGTGPPPLDTDKLVQLPNVKIEQKHVESKLQCSVCWDDFCIMEEVKILSCEHMYHPNCIIPWLKLHGTCPVCRKDLNEAGPGDDADGVDGTQTSGSGMSQTVHNPSRIDADDVVAVPAMDNDMEINYDYD